MSLPFLELKNPPINLGTLAFHCFLEPQKGDTFILFFFQSTPCLLPRKLGLYLLLAAMIKHVLSSVQCSTSFCFGPPYANVNLKWNWTPLEILSLVMQFRPQATSPCQLQYNLFSKSRRRPWHQEGLRNKWCMHDLGRMASSFSELLMGSMAQVLLLQEQLHMKLDKSIERLLHLAKNKASFLLDPIGQGNGKLAMASISNYGMIIGVGGKTSQFQLDFLYTTF